MVAPKARTGLPKIVLHVGSHKTGTTSIQYALAASRRYLSTHSIYYPNPKPFFEKQTAAHHDLAHALVATSPMAMDAAVRFRDHLREAAQSYDRILLSAEPFYRHVSGDSQEVGDITSENTLDLESEDAIWLRREKYIRNVSRFFEGFDVQILLYLRRPDSFAESLYKSDVVSTNYSGGFDRYIARRTFRFDYPKQRALFENNFGEVKLISYEKSLQQGLAASFFAALGIENSPGWYESGADRLRVSASGKAILWIDRLKQSQLLSKKDIERRWHFSLLDDSGLTREPKSTLWDSVNQRDGFLKTYLSAEFSDFFPPREATLPPRTGLDDVEFKALNARFEDWERDNSSYLARRERLGIPAYMVDEPKGPTEASVVQQVRSSERLTVAICCITRHRPKMLAALLNSWSQLRFPEEVQPVFVVVENDERPISEKRVLDARSSFTTGELLYVKESEVGIPYARNAAVNTAIRCGADLIAFIDDDETAAEDWFLNLYETYRKTGAQLVGGPVRASFNLTAKSSMQRMVMLGIADRYERVERKAQSRARQGKANRISILTNNWLADADLFRKLGLTFDESLRFTGGSDTKFYRDAISQGVKTAWAPDALVFETVPAERITLRYQFSRGKDQSTTSIRAKIADRGRGAILPLLIMSIGVRAMGCLALLFAAPFTGGRTLVGCARSSGWIAGRIAGFRGRESGLYKNPTGD